MWHDFPLFFSLIYSFICLFPQSEQQLDCALDLMRRLPPQQIEKNLSDLIDLVSAAPVNLGMDSSVQFKPCLN